MTTVEAKKTLKVSTNTLKKMVSDGKIKMRKIDGKNVFDDSDVLVLINTNTPTLDSKSNKNVNVECMAKQYNDCIVGKVVKGARVLLAREHFEQIQADFGIDNMFVEVK